MQRDSNDRQNVLYFNLNDCNDKTKLFLKCHKYY